MFFKSEKKRKICILEHCVLELSRSILCRECVFGICNMYLFLLLAHYVPNVVREEYMRSV